VQRVVDFEIFGVDVAEGMLGGLKIGIDGHDLTFQGALQAVGKIKTAADHLLGAGIGNRSIGGPYFQMREPRLEIRIVKQRIQLGDAGSRKACRCRQRLDFLLRQTLDQQGGGPRFAVQRLVGNQPRRQIAGRNRRDQNDEAAGDQELCRKSPLSAPAQDVREQSRGARSPGRHILIRAGIAAMQVFVRQNLPPMPIALSYSQYYPTKESTNFVL